MTDCGCALATSTSGLSPLTMTFSDSVATPSVRSIVALAPTSRTIARLVAAKPVSSAVIEYGPGWRLTAR